MATVPEIIPVTDLRQDAAAVLKRVQAAHQPLVITQRGRAAAIMLSVEAYERGNGNANYCGSSCAESKRLRLAWGTTLTRCWQKQIPSSRTRHSEGPLHPHGSRPVSRSHRIHSAGEPAAAVRFRQRAEQALRRLEQFPESGRVVPEFPDLPYREVIVPPFRFFYRIKEVAVWVVAVWHGAQPREEPRL